MVGKQEVIQFLPVCTLPDQNWSKNGTHYLERCIIAEAMRRTFRFVGSLRDAYPWVHRTIVICF
jgi:hypothetical protein